ncbi:MAG TPA: redoxin domain-containing protein [Planctomycetaceae bacterium]|nr:redoxin domain-containing protein [Planctomycetaceae bacterium]
MGSQGGTMSWRLSPWAAAVLLLVATLSAGTGCGPSDNDSRPADQSERAAGDRDAAGAAASRPAGSADAAGRRVSPSAAAQSGASSPNASSATRPAAGSAPSAHDVLKRMAQLYKAAASYGDHGRITIQGQIDGRQLNQQADYLVAFQRPNKLRLQAYQGIVVCDGEALWAFVASLPNQVVRRDGPAEITLRSLLFDRLLVEAIAQPWTQVYSLMPLQVLLLVADDPLKTLLHGAREVERIESAAIGAASCYRIQLTRPDGRAVLWIDEQSFVLRRVEFPTAALNKSLAQGRIRDFSVVADLSDAQINGPIDSNAFAFVMPEQAETVEAFLPPNLRLLGRPAPEFVFVDLEGNQITPATLAGKVAVLDFWATWCGPCRDSLPVLDQVYRQLDSKDRVAVLAVSVDDASVSDDQLRQTFKELGVELPIARDPRQFAGKSFYVTGIPATVLLDSEGKVQEMTAGFHAGYANELSQKLQKLLAGEDIFQPSLEQFHADGQRILQWLADKADQDSYWGPLAVAPPTAEIAQRTEPEKLRMKLLWRCRDLELPGNLLAVDGPQGTERILALEKESAVAELSPDGELLATHPLPVEPGEPMQLLRAVQAADGRRWFVVSASGAKQLHLLNDRLQPVLAYPPDVDRFPHAGIGDVQAGDLDNDGVPEICVGYWGDVGVQGVSLEGRRLWRNRRLSQVLRMAVLGLDKLGRRNLLCTNQLGNLVMIDRAGNTVAEITVTGRPAIWVVSADLDGEDPMELCALSPTNEGGHVALGINLHGDVLWEYPLPAGMHEHAIEPVTAGRLLAHGPASWILAGPDGSIHVLSPTGQLIDRFHYGAALTGLAAARIGGQPALVVATPEGIDAWRIEGAE